MSKPELSLRNTYRSFESLARASNSSRDFAPKGRYRFARSSRPKTLALGVWSLQYNLGPGHSAGFIDAYGIDLDAEQLRLVTNENGEEALERL